MSEASYVLRTVTFGAAGALVVGVIAAYFASQAPLGQRPQPRLIQVECLNVERGPTLHFAGGLLMDGNATVGTYKFLPAVPGKHGPLISVDGIRVREVGEALVIEAGSEGWFWRYLDDDTVKISHYGQQSPALAHRCTT